MKKRFLSALLCLCMAAGLLPGLAVPTAAYSTGDTYPSEYKNAAADSLIDRWNFYNRECTSFAAWCLNDRNGVGFTNWYGGVRWGNANNWGNAARSLGITVDATPAVGAVAWWNTGTYGHVAWVSAVNGDSVTIEEYNYNYAYAWHTRTISRTAPSGYIHIKDIETYPINALNLGDDFYAYISYPNGNLNLENRNDNVQTAARSASDPRQIWHFIRLGDGAYNIVNMYDGRYLDVLNGGGSGTNVWACTGNGDTPQKWKIVNDAYGMSGAYNLLISYNNSLALDIDNANTSSGANAQIWARNGTAAQAFQINKLTQYTVSINASSSAGGVLSGGGKYYCFESASIAAMPYNGYRFVGWAENGNIVSTDASYTFNVSDNRTLTAVFEKEQAPSFTITAVASPSAGGTVTGGGAYEDGQSVTVKAAASSGYTFKGWTENGSTVSTDTSYPFTVSASRTLTAVFEKTAPADTAAVSVEREINDTIEYANRIAVNTEIAGSLSKSSDVDWYVFQIPNDGYISLTFDHDFVNSSSFYWKTAFYTSGNQELNSWQWRGNATSAETGSKIGLPAGTYYLRISDWSYSDAAYRFKVNYTPSSSWEKEFNETIVTANRISTGTEISGSLRNSSDVDWYQFELPEDGMVSLTFDHDFVNSSSFYWKTAFYTSDNQELNSWQWRGNAMSAETGGKIGLPAGTYYLRISDWSYSDADYRFKVNYTPSFSWEKEFNETIVTADRISTGTEISGSLRNSSDVDWYQFELPEDGMISLTFDHDFVNSSSFYWKTAFYTSGNQELNSWSWRGNATSAETESKIGVSAGTYYLRISDWSYSDAAYRFKVNYEPSGNPAAGDEQKPAAVSGITLNRTSLSLTPGSSAVLTAEVTPSDAADKTVVWRSENTAVAAVANGRVTAVGEGSTRITASCGSVTASCAVSVTAEGGQPQPGGVHFERVNIYFQDQFTDVPANQWYTDEVSNAFELGLMVGDSTTTFDPYGNVTIAQTVTMAARIHSIYTRGYEDFQQTGDKWYQVYMDYAYENKIISLAYYNCDVSQKASRAQFAEIFANSLPAEGLSAINDVADGAIPDVGMGNRYAEYIYKLYRAGILAGSDANGTFNPSTYITRAEAAAIVSRMAESDHRVSITLR